MRGFERRRPYLAAAAARDKAAVVGAAGADAPVDPILAARYDEKIEAGAFDG
jgi:hypothetical protein